MNLSELREKIKNKQFAGAAIDSRKLKENEVFFALKGEKVDGHCFLAEAAQKKCSAAVVSKNYSGKDFGLQLFLVDDVLAALHQLAREIFSERKSQSIAVTGSVGKTTTKEFIATLLEEKFKVGKTPGTYNSQATLPLSLLNAEGDETVFVMEMGMSLPGELTRLVAVAPPDIAFVGRLGLAHAASFPEGIEGIARAKAEIISSLKTHSAILHHETSRFQVFEEMTQISKLIYDGPEFKLQKKGQGWCVREKETESPCFRFPFEASHLRENALGAIAVARMLGMHWEEILPQVEKLKLISHRFETLEKDGILFINDSYNANPTSMRAALQNLPSPQLGGKKIAVLGEMRELGTFSQDSHREIGELALSCIDKLLCFGEACTPLAEVFAQKGRDVKLFTDFMPLRQELLRIATKGDVVLIKGSNSKQMWTLLE